MLIHSEKTVTNMYSRFHEAIELKLVTSGKLTVMVDTQPIMASEGEIIFINPYEVHSNLLIDNAEIRYDLVMISLDFFERTGIGGIDLRKIFIENQTQFKNIIKNDKVVNVTKRLVASLQEDDTYSKLYASGLLLELFALLQRSEAKPNEGSITDKGVKFFHSIEPAVMKIRDDYRSQLSGEELAEMCGMSKYHFCRTFKRVMGITPVQYQTECRLRIADILLQNADLSISAVGAKVGFEDEAYFSRCYKKHRGLSPKAKRAKLSK